MEEIDCIIGKIKASPLFYLFAASNELFHSNFLFWLSTLDKSNALKIFIQDSGLNSDEIFFKREHNQKTDKIKSKVDLLINEIIENGKKKKNNPIVVIENKVKDYPRIEQLERIEGSFGNKSEIKYILISLFPIQKEQIGSWESLSYSDLANRIENLNKSQNQYYNYLIEDFCAFSKNLSSLVNKLTVTNHYDFPRKFFKKRKELDSVRLWESFQKYRGSHLIQTYNNQFNDKFNANYEVNPSKNVVLGFSLPLSEDYNIGVQIENDEFRRFIEGPKHDTFANNLRDKNIFFDSKWISKRGLIFRKYDPNFKYQFEKINDKKRSFEALFNEINKVYAEIQENLNSIKGLIPSD